MAMNIFITGVSSGIGRELTKQLLAAGHTVWGIARREQLLNDLESEVSTEHFHSIVCDITDESHINRVTSAMQQEQFFPDVVVLNAAIDQEDMDNGFSYETAKKIIMVNVLGALRWVEIFLPGFMKKKHGQFIAISSLFAFWPDPRSASYSASKSALSMAFRCLRTQFGHSGVCFKTMYFGPIDTHINPRFQISPLPTKTTLLIASPKAAAKSILKAISSSRQSFYFPWYMILLRYCGFWIPDSLFEFLTKKLRR